MNPSPPPEPLVSVVIPTCRADGDLPDCLRSLAAQSLRAHEVIVVDNGSSDDALVALVAAFPDVRLVRLEGRQGFSKPVNAGCRVARGELFFVLNDDTVLAADCLEQLVASAQARPDASFFAALMVYADAPETVNSAAHMLLPSGVVLDWGRGQPAAGEFLKPQPVFGACAGAALYRRSLYEALGGFDEDFYFLVEDVDFDFRAQLAGHTCWTVPTARVRHRVSQSLSASSPAAVEAGFGNLALTLLKNLPAGFWRRHRREILGQWWRNLAAEVRRGMSAPLCHAAGTVYRRAPRMLRKRRAQVEGLRQHAGTIESWAAWSAAPVACGSGDGDPAVASQGRLRRMLGPGSLALGLLVCALPWFALAGLGDRWVWRCVRPGGEGP